MSNRPPVAVPLRPQVWPLQQVCECGPDSWVYYAASNDDVGEVESASREPSFVKALNWRDPKHGITALGVAVAWGYRRVVDIILKYCKEHGVEVAPLLERHCISPDFHAPLFVAAIHNYRDLLTQLLPHIPVDHPVMTEYWQVSPGQSLSGARVDARVSSEGDGAEAVTLGMCVAAMGHPDVLRPLLAAGAPMMAAPTNRCLTDALTLAIDYPDLTPSTLYPPRCTPPIPAADLPAERPPRQSPAGFAPGPSSEGASAQPPPRMPPAAAGELPTHQKQQADRETVSNDPLRAVEPSGGSGAEALARGVDSLDTQELAETKLSREDQFIPVVVYQGAPLSDFFDRKDGLALMYRRAHRKPKDLAQLAQLFKANVEREGMALVGVMNETVLKNMVEDKNSPGKFRAGGGSHEQLYVQKILDLHDKCLLCVTECFANTAIFHKALKEAFEALCRIPLHGWTLPELVAKFCDNLLKKDGSEKLSDREFNETCKKVVKLLGYISDKDLFDWCYQKLLARRLLLEWSPSVERERLILTWLQGQNGHPLTSKMEGMLIDMQTARKKQIAFEKWKNIKGKKLPIDLSVTVTTRGLWPTYKAEDLPLPSQMADCLESFQLFFTQTDKSKELVWKHGMGMVNLMCFSKPRVDITCGTYEACILMLFEHADKLSYAEIKEQLDWPEEIVRDSLQSLVTWESKILRKEPDDTTIGKTDTFLLNVKFTDKMRETKPTSPPVDEDEDCAEAADIAYEAGPSLATACPSHDREAGARQADPTRVHEGGRVGDGLQSQGPPAVHSREGSASEPLQGCVEDEDGSGEGGERQGNFEETGYGTDLGMGHLACILLLLRTRVYGITPQQRDHVLAALGETPSWQGKEVQRLQRFMNDRLRQCKLCDRWGHWHLCRRCLCTAYCSEAHHRADWRQHRRTCVPPTAPPPAIPLPPVNVLPPVDEKKKKQGHKKVIEDRRFAIGIDDEDSVFVDADKERHIAVDAAIVQTMKSHKVLLHQQLMLKVIPKLTVFFTPEIRHIKKRIESLIEREFIEQDTENPKLYKYIP